MSHIFVRVTDSSGDLVDSFSTNAAGLADDRIAMLTRDFARWEPAEVLTAKRTDQGWDGHS